MSNIIAIVGESGTGKSRSISTLDPNTTYIINVKSQPLPWRGSASMYNTEKKNTANTDKWNEVISILEGISANRKEIKTIIIDDAGFIMATEFFKRASEGGYGKYGEMGQHMFNILDTAKKLRNDLSVILTFHPDVETDSLGNTTRKIKTIGKMLEDKYTPEASFSIVLYSHVDFDKDGKGQYKFVTNRTVNYPAKSPEGMFDLFIENDLKFVLDKIQEYLY